MSKVIKVDDEVYNDLDKLRVKGETFGEIIDMLLRGRITVLEMISVLEGSLKYHEYREQKLKELEKKVAEG